MTNKITVQGSAPKYEEAVLKQHQLERRTEYNTSRESHEYVFGELPFDFICQIVELSKQGYELSNRFPLSFAQLSNHAWMRKPDHLTEADLVALDIKTKESYVAWLESERESFKQKLTQQLLQAAALKEKKKEQDKEAKLLREIQAEVDATFADLVIPD